MGNNTDSPTASAMLYLGFDNRAPLAKYDRSVLFVFVFCLCLFFSLFLFISQSTGSLNTACSTSRWDSYSIR